MLKVGMLSLQLCDGRVISGACPLGSLTPSWRIGSHGAMDSMGMESRIEEIAHGLLEERVPPACVGDPAVEMAEGDDEAPFAAGVGV